MSKMHPDNRHIASALRQATGLSVAPAALRFLSGSGLNHDHIVIGETGWLMRIPRGNTNGQPELYLQEQAAIYKAAAASGHTPEVYATIQPLAALPNGALVVRYIQNAGKADFTHDFKAIATALAAIQRSAPPSTIKPLSVAGASQRQYIEAMFDPAFTKAYLLTETRTLLNHARDEARIALNALAQATDLPLTLIASDSHPGNFLIQRDGQGDRQNGRAWMVDMEYATIDCPLIDIAMASCPLSAQFDPQSRQSPVSQQTRDDFFAAWLADFGGNAPEVTQNALRAHRTDMEKIVLLGSLGWLLFWQTEGCQTMTRIDPATRKHWDKLAKQYLEPQTLRALLTERMFNVSRTNRPLNPQATIKPPYRRPD